MCCVWPSPEDIRNTNILARSDGSKQLLVYQMAFAAKESVAMTLPVPVELPARADSLRFLDMSEEPKVLERLRATIPEPMRAVTTRSLGFDDELLDDEDNLELLEVHEVGSYHATFVPRRADFGRVDPRFVLPDFFWEQVHAYDDWGFAIFQLQPGRGSTEVEPMGFVFDSRFADRLFFPTLHLHSDELEEEAFFDHRLLAQGLELGPRPKLGLAEARAALNRAQADFEEFSWDPPRNEDGWVDSMKPLRAALYGRPLPPALEPWLDLEEPLFGKRIGGRHPNEDTWARLVDVLAPMPALRE